MQKYSSANETRPTPRPLHVEKERTPLTLALNAAAAIAVLLLLVWAGYHAGIRDNADMIGHAGLEVGRLASTSHMSMDTATHWMEEATEASKTIDALESELASTTADLEFYKGRAEEASATISTLKSQLQQMKRSRSSAPAVQASVTSTATAGWSTASVSWYGPGFIGNTMAGGGTLQWDSMVVAHRKLAFGTLIEFEYNGRTCIAEVRDRGPYVDGRLFDLGPGTAAALGFSGVHPVRYRVVG